MFPTKEEKIVDEIKSSTNEVMEEKCDIKIYDVEYEVLDIPYNDMMSDKEKHDTIMNHLLSEIHNTNL